MTLEEAKIIEKRFDSFCVRVIRNAARDYRRYLVRRIKHEVLYSELSEGLAANSFPSEDVYDLCSTPFLVPSMKRPVVVHDEDLSMAMEVLPESLRNVVLLSYFLEMSDSKIAKILHISQPAVKKRRKKAIRILRQLLKGFEDEI